MIFIHGRSSPQTSPSATPCLLKSLSFEAQPEDLEEHPLSPMQYARSGLGIAALNGKLIAAGQHSVLQSFNGLYGAIVFLGGRGFTLAKLTFWSRSLSIHLNFVQTMKKESVPINLSFILNMYKMYLHLIKKRVN